jgi:pimeloyl-ACP methyl ester carboxylesterase
MNKISMYSRPTMRPWKVIALHCSGAGRREWTPLAEVLGRARELLTPEHYGCDSSGPWGGEHAFTVADEAARTLTLIDQNDEKMHLVGHSYGGGVALHVALARRNQITSLALYEPSAFHLLLQLGGPGIAAYAEIRDLARDVSQRIVTGDYRAAAAAFVNYWNGPRAWDVMPPRAQSALIRWVPKAPLDFRALMENRTPASVYRELDFPVLIMRGEHGPLPTRLIAEALFELLPQSQLLTVPGAGHMGPVTHASEISGLVKQHIVDIEASTQPRLWSAQADSRELVACS